MGSNQKVRSRVEIAQGPHSGLCLGASPRHLTSSLAIRTSGRRRPRHQALLTRHPSSWTSPSELPPDRSALSQGDGEGEKSQGRSTNCCMVNASFVTRRYYGPNDGVGNQQWMKERGRYTTPPRDSTECLAPRPSSRVAENLTHDATFPRRNGPRPPGPMELWE